MCKLLVFAGAAITEAPTKAADRGSIEATELLNKRPSTRITPFDMLFNPVKLAHCVKSQSALMVDEGYEKFYWPELKLQTEEGGTGYKTKCASD